MRIINEKTGVTFKALTRKNGAVYRAVVIEVAQYQGITMSEVVVYHAQGFATRGKARSAAERACKACAANHAFIN